MEQAAEEDPLEKIRPSCFLPFSEGWTPPTPYEVRQLIKKTGLSRSNVVKLLGLSTEQNKGLRKLRKWTGEKVGGDGSENAEKPISYAAWAVLCSEAGLGHIASHKYKKTTS